MKTTNRKQSSVLLTMILVALARPAAAATPGPTTEQLTKLAENLADLALTAKDTSATKQLPPWVFLGPGSGRRLEGQMRPKRAALEAIIGSKAPAKVRGLALLWLAHARNVDDLPLIESYLDNTDAAGSYPTLLMSQSVRRSYGLDWQSLTLGDIAFRSATMIVGHNYGGVAGYRSWRKSQGDLRDSFEYWSNQAATSRSAKEGRATLTPLLAHNPDLFLRVLLVRGAVRAFPASELQKLVQNKLSAKKLLKLVALEEQWPEFKNKTHYGRFCRWVFDNWQALFEKQEAKKLLELWRDPQFAKDVVWVRRHLAVAAARANPAQGLKILTQALKQKPTPQMDAVLKEMVGNYLPGATKPAIAWFLDAQSLDADRLTIVRYMGGAGLNGKRSLAKLIRAKGFRVDNGAIITAMVKAIRGWGAALDPICLGSLDAPRRKGRITPHERLKEAAANRRKCTGSLRRWARSAR